MHNSSDTIEHFGVKGMRWGHRNRREYLTKKYIAKGYNPKAARMSKMNADIDSMLNDLLGKSSTTRRGANGRRIKDVTNSLKG